MLDRGLIYNQMERLPTPVTNQRGTDLISSEIKIVDLVTQAIVHQALIHEGSLRFIPEECISRFHPQNDETMTIARNTYSLIESLAQSELGLDVSTALGVVSGALSARRWPTTSAQTAMTYFDVRTPELLVSNEHEHSGLDTREFMRVPVGPIHE